MKKRCIVTFIAGALAIATVCVGWNAAVNYEGFWNVTAAQVLTLLVTLGIAFWATQYKNDQRSAKAHAEKIITKIQDIVESEAFYSFVPGSDEETIKKNYRMAQRKLSNCLLVLKEYGKQLGFEEDAEYIEEQIDEYKSFVSEKLNDFEYLNKSETHLRKLAQNIDSKCDLIVVNFYK